MASLRGGGRPKAIAAARGGEQGFTQPVRVACGRSVGFGWPVMARACEPDSLPRPGQPAGTVDDAMPFDHIVVVMMENHSFDNLLGGLARSGQPAADGLTFDSAGRATNTNPGA